MVKDLVEILVLGTEEKQIYNLFFDGRNKYELFFDDLKYLSLGVYGLKDERAYKRDENNILPKWFITQSLKFNNKPDKSGHSETIGELIIKPEPKGLLFRFLSREENESYELRNFVVKIINRIRTTSEVFIISCISPEFLQALSKPLDQLPKINIPQKPNNKTNIDEWFDYYHNMKNYKKEHPETEKYILEELAKDVNRTPGDVRKKHTKYLIDQNNKE